MHVVASCFEAGGFDVTMMRGGTSVYVWNLYRKFVERGHRVSVVTPSHGRIAALSSRYPLEDLGYRHRYRFPLRLDQRVWAGRAAAGELSLSTRAYRMTRAGIDFYFLDNEYLALLPDRFYPALASEGNDLSFFKNLVFQVDSVQFIRSRFAGTPTVVHAHEPFYQYLLPMAFAGCPDKPVVSTVMSNMPINKKVYRPQVAAVLDLLGVDLDLAGYVDPPGTEWAAAVLRALLPASEPDIDGEDYVSFFALVVDHAVLVDFMSDGQADFYATFRGTPFEEHRDLLTVGKLVKANVHKFFVGGCAIADEWLDRDPASVNRDALLRSLEFDPRLPTFYHSSRYSPHQKGQLELMRSIDRVLGDGPAANFIVRCAVATGRRVPPGTGNEVFRATASRYPGNLYLDWRLVGITEQYREAAAADFCVFPSKFELDTFLLAQGEAMACGAVPIATAQHGTRHFGHAMDIREPDATGFALDRSFRLDDPGLVDQLVARIREAIDLYRRQPGEYARLSGNARTVARRFTWDRCADRHVEAFDGLLPGRRS